MKKILILTIVLLMYTYHAYAGCSCTDGICTPDSNSAEDINYCFADGGWTSGATINIPAGDGTVTWDSKITILDSCIIKGPGESALTVTVDVGNAWNDCGIYATSLTSKTIEISDLTITTASTSSTGSFGVIYFHTTNSYLTFNIHHITFTDLHKRAISIDSVESYGVIHNITCTNEIVGATSFIHVKEPNYTDAWADSMSYGTANAVFLEDSTFVYHDVSASPDIMDAVEGSRTVVRFCTIDGAFLSNHGYDSIPRSTIHREAYGIKFKATNVSPNSSLGFRGGTGIVFNNTWYTKGMGINPIILLNYRSCSDGFTDDPAKNPCNGNGDPTESGGALYDGNTEPETTYRGWPCLDQIGRGTNQDSHPLYMFSNIYNSDSTIANAVIGDAGSENCYTSTHIQDNRDYYEEDTSFDGTEGVGVGVISARPATCTIGVAYWATDEGGNWNTSNADANDGILYRCTSTNTWEEYYTPYTYPHPLRGVGHRISNINSGGLTISNVGSGGLLVISNLH